MAPRPCPEPWASAAAKRMQRITVRPKTPPAARTPLRTVPVATERAHPPGRRRKRLLFPQNPPPAARTPLRTVPVATERAHPPKGGAAKPRVYPRKGTTAGLPKLGDTLARSPFGPERNRRDVATHPA